MAPLVSAQILDCYVNGAGLLEARLFGSLPVARAAGPEASRGELMRYLGELAWSPHAILHNPQLSWREIDASTIEVSATGETQQRTESIGKIIEEAAALALIGAKERGIKVQLQLAPRLPDVLIDKVQIQQVVVNLIRNAIEAMEASYRRDLTISVKMIDQGVIVISIIDTGPGIAPEVAKRLFQPFVTTKVQGMGVGLSICRSIVEAHNGRLWAAPNPDGGTIFRFTVPAVR